MQSSGTKKSDYDFLCGLQSLKWSELYYYPLVSQNIIEYCWICSELNSLFCFLNVKLFSQGLLYCTWWLHSCLYYVSSYFNLYSIYFFYTSHFCEFKIKCAVNVIFEGTRWKIWNFISVGQSKEKNYLNVHTDTKKTGEVKNEETKESCHTTILTSNMVLHS
jgi:hypothetical protein